MKTKTILMLTAAMAFSAALAANVEVASPFADGMVLQRGMKVPVWGWADPGTLVSVSFAGVTRTATAGADRKWRVDLPPMEASKESRELKVNDMVFRDVVVGEVWFCSGQSNMALQLVGNNPRSRDRQGALVAQTTVRPYIRFAHVKAGTRMKPAEKLAQPVKWLDFRPTTCSRTCRPSRSTARSNCMAHLKSRLEWTGSIGAVCVLSLGCRTKASARCQAWRLRRSTYYA